MASGTLLDLNSSEGSGSAPLGPRAFLTRANMIGLRVLLVLYVPTIALILAMNYQPVGHAMFGLISQHLWVALTFGIMVVLAVSTFLVLLAMDLHHFWRGHVGPRPASWWLWVIVLLNVAGVVAYYLRVIEPEQRALGASGGLPASAGGHLGG